MNDISHGRLRDGVLGYLVRIRAAVDALPVDSVELLVERLMFAREEEQTVFIFGNGGSAATSSHMASDLSKSTIQPSLPRLKAISLTDNTPVFTAWANDVDYSSVFAEQLRTFAKAGDVAIAISASGNSPNVVEGIKVARELGLYSIGLLGFDGGLAAGLVDLPIIVSSYEYGPVEDMHLLLNHLTVTVLNELAGYSLDGLPEPVKDKIALRQ